MDEVQERGRGVNRGLEMRELKALFSCQRNDLIVKK